MFSSIPQDFRRLIPPNSSLNSLYKPIELFLQRGGKRLRPLLCSLCAEVAGESKDRAMHAGLAIEFFHNFTLIHDDIEDNSLLRRGQPCLHIQHGIPLAINMGDLLFCLATQAIVDAPYHDEEKIILLKLLNKHFLQVFEGQSMELEWHHTKQWNLKEEDYFAMVERKTGALIAIACKIGAYLGGATTEQQELLYKWGRALGVAFQIQDDVLNLIGSEEKYKKEIGGDITEGKRTLMVLHALNNKEVSQSDKDHLRQILDSNSNDPKEIHWCISLLSKTGAIAYAQKKSAELILTTTEPLEKHLTPSISRDKLLKLAYGLITREA